MLCPLGRFDDPDNTIGWHVLPILGSHPPKAYLSLSDLIEVSTDDPALLDLLADKASKAAKALRIAYGEQVCDGCGAVVARVFPRTIPIGGADYATDGEFETVYVCAGCGGEDPDDLDEPTSNEAAAA